MNAGMNARYLRWSALTACLVGQAACSTSAAQTTIYENEPYEGEAYPNRRPKLAIPAGGMGVVSDSLSDTLSFIDLSTGERFASYPVGRDPVSIDGPHHVVVDPKGGFVYVALSYPPVAGATGPHAAHGESTLPGYVQKLALDDLRPLGQARVDPNPGDIVLSEDGKRVVVSHFDLKRALANPANIDAARATLAVVDPEKVLASGSADPVKIPVCIAAHGMVLSKPDAKKAYVACYGEDSIAVVDLDDPKAAITRVPLGPDAAPYNPAYGPYATVMSPDGGTIAVSSTVSKDVRFFDVASGAFTGKVIKTLGAPYFVAWTPDGKQIYVPTQQPDAVSLVDVSGDDPQEIAYKDLGGQCDLPHVISFEDGQSLYVVCEGDKTQVGQVVRLDPSSLEVMKSTDVGVFPDAFFRVTEGAQ